MAVTSLKSINLLGINNLQRNNFLIYLEHFRENSQVRENGKTNIFVTTLIPAAFHFDTNTDPDMTLDIPYFCSKVKTL